MNHILVISFTFCFLSIAQADPPQQTSPINFGPEEIIKANGGDIKVPGYSVPSFVDWNNDGLRDLVIGQGSGSYPPGKVRVYLNVGTESSPQFTDYFFVQSQDADLTVPATGCMGCFPRVVYWDSDDRKDLLMGLSDGTIKIFLNISDNNEPAFDSGSDVQTFLIDSEIDVRINVGARATPAFLDWDMDGKTDLVTGAFDGKIHIYLNCGCSDEVPLFWSLLPSGTFVQEDDHDLIVPSRRSSPVIFDLDRDGKADLLTGNTDGQLLFYRNLGPDYLPTFSGYLPVESNDVPIDLVGSPRSRPSVCFWAADSYPDVLIGAGDGKVHLFQGIPETCDINLDGDVDFIDFALFAIHWRQSDSKKFSEDFDKPLRDKLSRAADFTNDDKINIDDLRMLAENWLSSRRSAEPQPERIP